MNPQSLIPALIALLFLGTGGTGFSLGTPRTADQAVSIIRLIATPEKFTGQGVQISGWLSVSLGEDSVSFVLYPSHESLLFHESTEAIQLDEASLAKILPQPRAVWQALHGERIRIQGKFLWDEPKDEHDTRRRLIEINYLQQEKPGSPIFTNSN